MLKLDHVSKKLNTFQLHDISFELPSGHIMGLVGENGAGKTSLIHILSGLYSIDQGEISFNGMKYDKEESEIKQEIGVVIHGSGLFDRQDTLIGNADYYGRFYCNYDAALLRILLEQLRLDGRKKYSRLSKGEALKFAMAFALSHKPRLLLLDEPTANFDKDFRKQFFDLLRDYTANGKNSVILSTHITSDIDKTADYLLYLQKGCPLLYDDIERIRGNYRIAAGEEYKLRLLKDRVIHMEKGEFGCKALVYNSKKPFDPALKVWEPSIEELMYFTARKNKR
ncbi:MAG: ABC transporter ATP-binding protein [Lachnospiraceae bacterium]|nr:ABC transporter ATP-binding protein [Lachnospiraceae bacterium]